MNRNFAGNIGTGGGAISAPGTPLAEVDPLLSDREAADIIGCGRSTIWRWASEGTLRKPIKIGGLSRWKLSWIQGLIQDAENGQEVA